MRRRRVCNGVMAAGAVAAAVAVFGLGSPLLATAAVCLVWAALLVKVLSGSNAASVMTDAEQTAAIHAFYREMGANRRRHQRIEQAKNLIDPGEHTTH